MLIALRNDLSFWVTQGLAILRGSHETVWAGMNVKTKQGYFMTSSAAKLRIFTSTSASGRDDLVFWLASAGGNAKFLESKSRCSERKDRLCFLHTDTLAGNRWECVIVGTAPDDSAEKIGRCFFEAGQIGVLYRCAGQTCEDFDRIIRDAFATSRAAATIAPNP
jgi:hypothetical protein